MRFQLMGDWPASQFLIPAGTIINGNSPEWAGVPMPMNAKALDQEAADYLTTTYPHHLHELHCAAGVTLRKLINIGD
jgi:hypothetical protein